MAGPSSRRSPLWAPARSAGGSRPSSPSQASGSACSPAATRSACVRAEGLRLDEQGEEFVARSRSPDNCQDVGRAGCRHHRGQGAGAARARVRARAADRAGNRRSFRCSTACRGGSSTAAARVGRSRRQHRGGDSVRASDRLRRPRLVQPHRAQPRRRQACRKADHRRTAAARPASGWRACCALLDGAGLKPRPDRQCPPRDLVQIVGQCDDQPAVGADPRDLRPDPRRSRMPRLDARRRWPSSRRVGAAIGCPISESGEDRMQVTARLGAFKTSMLQDVEAGRPIELEALLGAPREIARAPVRSRHPRSTGFTTSPG